MKFGHFIHSKARIVAAMILAVLVILALDGGYVLKGLRTEYSVRQFMNPKNPMLISEFKVKDDFALPEWPAVYVTVSLSEGEQGSFLESDRVAHLREATQETEALAGVTRVIDIASVEGASSTNDGLTVGKVLDLTPKENWSNRVLRDPLLTPSLISRDGRTALVSVGLTELDTQLMSKLPDELRTTFKRQFPNSSVYVGGIPAIQSEMAGLLKSELRNFLILALMACLITLASFFRDRASIFVPILLVGFANIGALCWMVAAKIPFTVLSTTLPVLVSIIVLSMVTHTMIGFSNDWKQALRTGHADKVNVVFKTMHALFLPNLLTALTTSLGFVALLTATVPLIHDYAECVAVGVLIAWACVMLALPPILILMSVPQPRSWTSQKARWALSIKKYSWPIVLSVFAIGAGLAWKGRNLNWSARLFDDLPAQQEARITSEFIDQNLGAVIPMDLVIRSKITDVWNDPDHIKSLDTLLENLRKIGGVGSAIGLSDFVQAGSRAQNLPLPDSRAGVAEIIFIYSLSPDRILSQYLTPDGSQTRVAIRVRDLPAGQMRIAVDRIRSEAESVFPDFEVQTVGMASNVHVINRELCEDLIYGFWQAILLISVVLMVIFRSLRWTLVAMLPNLISPVSLMGVMALTETPIKPGIALIFSIALGIAYNNTVYLLGRVRLLASRKASRGGGLSFGGEELPVTKAWYQEGNPCIFSTLALVGGFAVFMASYFELNRLFGVYMLLSIAAGMLGDLIFLPALLTLFPQLIAPLRKEVLVPVIEETDSELPERLAA